MKTKIEAYQAILAEIKELTAKLNKQLTDHERLFLQHPDWSYIGDLGHIREELKNITKFINL